MNLKSILLLLSQLNHEDFEQELIYDYIIPIGVVIISLFVVFRLLKIFLHFYALGFKKPISKNTYIIRNNLSPNQHAILQKEYSFFRKLSEKDKRHFEHRVAKFIKHKDFIGKEGLVVTDTMKVLIAATAVMLTFGFKNYSLDIVKTIIIFPKIFYSNTNEAFHKGETNPKLKVIVFSWEDFVEGYHIGDDNLNLGIHEFGHAIHINAFLGSDMSSLIFKQGFNNLTEYLQKNENVRETLIASNYFRAYAYTNHFEFFAVLLENFIETPVPFKSQFPVLYNYMREMLNFKFAGY